MTIKVWLDGDRADLDELARLLADGPVRVLRDETEDAYYLAAAEIDNPANTDPLDTSAERLITRINGLARARNADFRPVKFARKYTKPDGRNVYTASATLEVRVSLAMEGVAIGPDGQPQPQPPSPWPGYLAAADSNPEVAEVLAIMGRDERGWVELYKVYELIRRAVKSKTIVERGWATDTEVSAFTASANRPDVSGDAARHAVPQGSEPPRSTMAIEQGRSFIGALVTRWLAANP